MKYYILIITALLFLAGCTAEEKYQPKKVILKDSTFSFTMMDTSGSALVEGILTIRKMKGFEISGDYKFTAEYNTDFEGYQTMKGEFTGTVDTLQRYFIRTNPKLEDNCIFFKYEIKRDSIHGIWYYSTIMGKKSEGPLSLKQ